jgi:hypothetical protein
VGLEIALEEVVGLAGKIAIKGKIPPKWLPEA